MLKIIHTNIQTGLKEESKLADQAAWGAHSYFENSEWTNEVVDISSEVATESEDLVSEAAMQAGHKALRRIGAINRTKPAGIAAQLLASPQMLSIAVALLTGAPAAAKAVILALASDVYTQAEKDSVTLILDGAI